MSVGIAFNLRWPVPKWRDAETKTRAIGLLQRKIDEAELNFNQLGIKVKHYFHREMDGAMLGFTFQSGVNEQRLIAVFEFIVELQESLHELVDDLRFTKISYSDQE